MLHLRVVVPTDLRDAVIETLRRQDGVANVLLFPDVEVTSGDDEISADVARESANDIIRELKSLEVHHRGAITLQPLDTVLSSKAHRVEEAAAGDAADAMVWDELIARTREDSTLTATFMAFLVIACLLAAIGVVHDSAVTVVGAMVVGPEFGPLAALAVGLHQHRFTLARQALIALLVGFPVAMAITAAATWVGKTVGWLSLADVQSVKQVDFIYEVGPTSLTVALLAGAAGMLSLVSSKSAALVGVFISVTTVPAAGFAAVAAVLGDWQVAGEAVAQLGINLVGIVTAGVLTLWARPAGARLWDAMSRGH